MIGVNDTLRDFFLYRLKVSMMSTGIRVPLPVVCYIAELLAKEPLMLPDTLFSIWEKANNESSKTSRLGIWREMGDYGLLLSGAFRDRVLSRGLTLGYCWNISQMGYSSLVGTLGNQSIYAAMHGVVPQASNLIEAAVRA